MSSHNQRHTIA